jgi:serine/threonine protein kinase/predicted TPR repeat methyltransferase
MHEDPTLPLSAEQLAAPDLALAHAEWGPFKLLARVGVGGFGEVYRAWDPSLEREVALKLLLPSANGALQTDIEYQSMLREARALAAIQHPNIVHVYGVDRHDNRVGFWTDFVKGRTLSALLATQGPFGYREAALIVLDIARALAAVHRANILHRDIKAENIMREEGGRILLMDFGLSALPQRDTHVAGTPNYIAPELWYGDPATVQTDIYALGILLFHLVTGDYPVRLGGLSAESVIAAIGNRRTLMDLRSDLPESFLRTVSTAMDPDPAKRFATAGQLAAALSESLGTAAPIETPAPTPAVVMAGWRKNLPLKIFGAVLVLATAAWQLPLVKNWFRSQQDSSVTANSAIPVDVSDEYLKAQDLLQHSYKDANLAAAVTGFQNVLTKDPANALAHAGLGTAYFDQYRNSSDPRLFDQAKAATNKAIQLDPSLAPAYATLARIEAMAGHTDLALQQAQKGVKLDPRNPEAQAALAEVYSAQGKASDAIDAIQKAIDLAPENSMWLVRLGGYYLIQGDSKQAADAWQKAVDLDPQNVSALYDLGVLEMRSDQLEQARSSFQKVLQIQPDADSYKTLATISLLQGDYGEAVAMGQKALSLNPNDYQSWGNLAGTYAWSGDRDKELSTYRKAIELARAQNVQSPDDANLSADLADYYASIGDVKDSLPLLRKALALSPSNSRISYEAGESYELLGQRARAIPLISKAIAKGYQPTLFDRSPEMASLRRDPAFKTALEEARAEKTVDTPK